MFMRYEEGRLKWASVGGRSTLLVLFWYGIELSD